MNAGHNYILRNCEFSTHIGSRDTTQGQTNRTPVQRECRIEDSNSIMDHLPNLTLRITSNTTTAIEIRRIARKVWPERQPLPSGAKLS
jgi:hypothetical protein